MTFHKIHILKHDVSSRPLLLTRLMVTWFWCIPHCSHAIGLNNKCKMIPCAIPRCLDRVSCLGDLFSCAHEHLPHCYFSHQNGWITCVLLSFLSNKFIITQITFEFFSKMYALFMFRQIDFLSKFLVTYVAFKLFLQNF